MMNQNDALLGIIVEKGLVMTPERLETLKQRMRSIAQPDYDFIEYLRYVDSKEFIKTFEDILVAFDEYIGTYKD